MDQEEKQLVEEANTLRARELDIAEKRTAAFLAIGRATLVTLVALAAAWWGIGVLAHLDLPWRHGFFWAAAAGGFFGLIATGNASTETYGEPVPWAVLTVLCVLVAALSFPY